MLVLLSDYFCARERYSGPIARLRDCSRARFMSTNRLVGRRAPNERPAAEERVASHLLNQRPHSRAATGQESVSVSNIVSGIVLSIRGNLGLFLQVFVIQRSCRIGAEVAMGK